MSRERNMEKKANEKAGGGGAKGIQERTVSKIGISCALCKLNFQSIKMKQQLKGEFKLSLYNTINYYHYLYRSLGS